MNLHTRGSVTCGVLLLSVGVQAFITSCPRSNQLVQRGQQLTEQSARICGGTDVISAAGRSPGIRMDKRQWSSVDGGMSKPVAPPAESVVRARIGRREAVSELRRLIGNMRSAQGGMESVDPSMEQPLYDLAQLCRRSGMPDMVLDVLNTYRQAMTPGTMAHGNHTADIWALIICAHTELGDVRVAVGVLEDCVRDGRLGLSPDDRGAAWRVGRILESLAKAGPAGLVMALELKEQLRAQRVYPDFRFYPVAIDAMWQSGPLMEMDPLSPETDIEGELVPVTLFPNAPWRTMDDLRDIVRRLSTASGIRRLAQSLYSEIESLGFKCSTAIKISMVRCFYRSAVGLNTTLIGAEWSDERGMRFEGAMQAAREAMSIYNITWGTPLTTALVEESLRVNDTLGATRLLKNMVRKKLLADTSMFHGLLRAFSQAGDVDTTLRLFDAMHETEMAKPDSLAYSLVISACLNARTRHEEAAALLKQAEESGMASGPELWQARIRLHALLHPSESIEPLIAAADAAGFPADPELVAWLLETYTCLKHPDRATELFSSLRWAKLHANPPTEGLSLLLPPPTREVHVAMIRSLCRNGRWPVAWGLVKRMQGRSQPSLAAWQVESMAPSRQCYAEVLRATTTAGLTEHALDVLKFMESKGVAPTEGCLVDIIRAFGLSKDASSALGVWEELKQSHIPARQAYEAILSACVRDASGLEPAIKILEDMKAAGYNLDRLCYVPFMESLGYDAIAILQTLEPFRLSVGMVEVDDDELAALMLAATRNGLNLNEAARVLQSLGLGLPAVMMTYLRLDQPSRASQQERKALLAGYEMRETMAELGWLALDTEYDNPAIVQAQYKEFRRFVIDHLRTLRQQIALLEQPPEVQRQHALLRELGLSGGVLVPPKVVSGEVAVDVSGSKAGRRMAKEERSRRQQEKIKEKRAAGPPRDQLNKARKLFGGPEGQPPLRASEPRREVPVTPNVTPPQRQKRSGAGAGPGNAAGSRQQPQQQQQRQEGGTAGSKPKRPQR